MILNEISSGIVHFEDLRIDKLLHVLENIKEFEATEKIDGSQILFGLDNNGFYTSRETKGGERIYSVEQYNIGFSTTYMRSAHMLLESVLPELKSAGLRQGDQVEAEVLYGELPNVVPYSADRNYLIFLRTTEGSVNINHLKQKLVGHSLSITLESPFTPDGRKIELKEESNIWNFSRSPIIKGKPPVLSKYITEVKKFLNRKDTFTGQSYGLIIDTPLNKIPEWVAPGTWKDIKEHLKERKEYINDFLIENYIMPVKEILLDHYVRNVSSEFGPSKADGGWIEGVVFRNSHGGMFKLVDKNKFGTIREAAWEMRNRLNEGAKSIDGNLSFLGELRVAMARALGHAELGTTHAKRYLFKTTILTEDIDAMSVKDYWLNIFDLRESKLNDLLTEYNREVRNSLYEDAIVRRTRESFAEAFRKIDEYRNLTISANDANDLLMALVGRYLTQD